MPSASRSPMRYPLRHGATCWSLGASAELSQRRRPRALPPPGGWARPLSASKQAPARPDRRSPPNPAARAHPAPGGRFYPTRGEPVSPGLSPASAAWSPVGAAVHARTRPPRLPSCPRVPAYRVPPAPQAPGRARSRSLGAIHSFTSRLSELRSQGKAAAPCGSRAAQGSMHLGRVLVRVFCARESGETLGMGCILQVPPPPSRDPETNFREILIVEALRFCSERMHPNTPIPHPGGGGGGGTAAELLPAVLAEGGELPGLHPEAGGVWRRF